MSETIPRSELPFVTTGHVDFDKILGGGLTPARLYPD
jgi:hypothetical protein